MYHEHGVQAPLHVLSIFISSLIQNLLSERIELRPELGFMPEMLQPRRHHGGQSV